MVTCCILNWGAPFVAENSGAFCAGNPEARPETLNSTAPPPLPVEPVHDSQIPETIPATLVNGTSLETLPHHPTVPVTPSPFRGASMDSLAYTPVVATQPAATQPPAPTAPPAPESFTKQKEPVPATVAESEVCDESASVAQNDGTPRDPNYWRPVLLYVFVIPICLTSAWFPVVVRFVRGFTGISSPRVAKWSVPQNRSNYGRPRKVVFYLVSPCFLSIASPSKVCSGRLS